MKQLTLILCLFSLMACGQKKDDSKPELDRRTSCGDKSEKCLPEIRTEIVSSKLPEMIRVSLEFGGDGSGSGYQVLDECDEYQSDLEQVTRGGATDLIEFILLGGEAKEIPANITITDLGADCDQEIVFFDKLVTSKVVKDPGLKDKMVFTLNN